MISITTGTSPAYNEDNRQPMVFFDNLLATGTLTNGTLPTNGPRSQAVDGNTYDYWATAGGRDTIRATLGAPRSAECAFIAAHNLSGTVVKVQRLVGATWTDTATFTPTSNDPFLMIFPAQTSDGWGFEVDGSKVIGVAMIGPRLVIPGGVTPDYNPIWSAKTINRYPNVSRGGHFLGQKIVSAGASLSANLLRVTYAFAQSTLQAFRDHHNDGLPFVWASAPAIFTTDVAYCWADDTLHTPILGGGDWCSLSLQMTAYCEP